MRINSIGKSYRPRFAAWSKKAISTIVKAHKRMVRHAGKQYLKTRHPHDFERMSRKLTDWDFD
jgi:hypothetical protein